MSGRGEDDRPSGSDRISHSAVRRAEGSRSCNYACVIDLPPEGSLAREALKLVGLLLALDRSGTGDMTFLTTSYRMEGLCVSQGDLDDARRLLHGVLQERAPDLLQASVGPFGRRWTTPHASDAAHLVLLAKCVHTLYHGSSEESRERVIAKLVELGRCNNEAQFEELETELYVGADLTTHFGTVEVEPFARGEGSGRVSASPDFAVDVDGSQVIVEVTMLYMGKMVAWEREVDTLRDRITELVTGASLVRQFEIEAPLDFHFNTIGKEQFRRLSDAIKSSGSGDLPLRAGGTKISIRWQPIPVVGSPEEFMALPPDVACAMYPGTAITACATTARFNVPSDFERRIFQSVKNTLKRKRKAQLRHSLPSILVLRLGNARWSPQSIADIFERRIFSNSAYEWLSAIAVAQYTFGGYSGFRSDVKVLSNPRGIHPLPDAFNNRLAQS